MGVKLGLSHKGRAWTDGVWEQGDEEKPEPMRKWREVGNDCIVWSFITLPFTFPGLLFKLSTTP
jgi:hypothetical protein